MSIFEKIKNRLEKNSHKYLWFSIFIFILVFSLLVYKKYYYFGYNISDLAIFNQTFFNTLHGQWFANTVGLNNYFSDHFSPILFLLLPFYAIKQSPITLLLVQVIVSALCAWPIYKIFFKNNGPVFAYGAALFWLLNPFVHRQLLYEFHIFHILIFFLFWAFYFFQEKRFWPYLIFLFLTLLSREDAVFLVLGFFPLALLEKRNWSWKLNSLLWPLIYFFLAIFLVRQISPSDNYKYLMYYDWLGGEGLYGIVWNWLSHPLAVLQHIFSLGNLGHIFVLFLPFLFIPFLAKRYLWFSFLPLAQFAMTGTGVNGVHLYTHYVMLPLFGIFLAYIFGLKVILEKKDKRSLKFVYRNWPLFKMIFVFSIVYFFFFMSPWLTLATQTYLPNYHQARQNILNKISDEDSVCADTSLLAALSNRQEVYDIDYVYFGKSQFAERDFILPAVDYIALDMSQFITTLNERNSRLMQAKADPLSMPDRWQKTLADYDLVYAQDNIFLWGNKKRNNANKLPYFEIKETDKELESLEIKEELFTKENQRVLKLSYGGLNSNNYLIRFYQGGKYWDLPFDYGLYSQSLWQAGYSIDVYYYLNPLIDSYEVYYYRGLNVLDDFGGASNFMAKKELVFGPQKIN